MSERVRFTLESLHHPTRWFVGGVLIDVTGANLDQDALLQKRLAVLGDYQPDGLNHGEGHFNAACFSAWRIHFSGIKEDPFERKGDITIRREAAVLGGEWLEAHYRDVASAIHSELTEQFPDLMTLVDLERRRQALFMVAKELLVGMRCKQDLLTRFGEEKIYPVAWVKQLAECSAEIHCIFQNFAEGASKLAERQTAPGDRAALKTIEHRLTKAGASWDSLHQSQSLYFLPVEDSLLRESDDLLNMIARDIAQRVAKFSEETRTEEPLKYEGMMETQRIVENLRKAVRTSRPELFETAKV